MNSVPLIFRENHYADRQGFERAVSEISSALTRVPVCDIDKVIDTSLQTILTLLRMDRAVLFQEEENGSRRMILTHFKVRPGYTPSVKVYLNSDSFPWTLRRLLNGSEARYSRADDLPDEAGIDKENIRKFGPNYSGMAVPLFNGDRVFGGLGLGICQSMVWPDELASRVRTIAQIFAVALLRSKAEQQLERALRELNDMKTRMGNAHMRPVQEASTQSAGTMVYKSQPMVRVIEAARQVASTNATVMLTGETGTGKEMLARLIHQWSSRCERPMVSVNCGAIPTALIESEMFGREKGAYTGALTRQIGRFELANGSTIFLDEVTELPLEVQVKLLRVLQEREIERLGNPKPIPVDVRIIAASNTNLEKAVKDGKFREDLYYRLNVFPIVLPPLSMRREDIPLLVWSFVDELSAAFGKKVERIPDENMEALMNYSWPGNVRELRNAIERAMIICSSPVLKVEPLTLVKAAEPSNLTLRELEVQHIRKVLENSSWRIRGRNGAAEVLGMKPTTLETRMAKLGILRPRV